jgi:hypothetical protein
VAVESREAAYGPVTRRTLGSPVLFSVVYTALAAGIYFGLGVVADRALGLTPLVLLAATAFFGLAAMTYVEAASLHQDRGGATVFARYAFNELVSFVAGWVIILDYVILVAVCAVSATHYAAGFWSPLDEGALATVIAVGIVLAVAVGAGRGFSRGASGASPRSPSPTCSSRSSSWWSACWRSSPRPSCWTPSSSARRRGGTRSSSPSAWPASCSSAWSRRPGCPARWRPAGATSSASSGPRRSPWRSSTSGSRSSG